MFMEDITGRPFNSKSLEGIEGNPYLLPDWSWGAVKFKNGKFAKDLSLHFSTYNNTLYFKKGNDQQEFVQPVNEFMLGYLNGADSVARIFRNGFPATESTKEETFFELLTDGKFQLLKLYTKKVTSFKPYNQAEQKKFSETQELYLLAPGKKMMKLKKDKKALLNDLPDYANQIEAVLQANNIKLKSEQSFQQLFALLNKTAG